VKIKIKNIPLAKQMNTIVKSTRECVSGCMARDYQGRGPGDDLHASARRKATNQHLRVKTSKVPPPRKK
jgi:hypothetical protein